MEIQEFKKAKEALSETIRILVYDAVEGFKRKTGFSPHNISIHMIETTDISSKSKEFRVGEVIVEVEI